MRTSEVFRTISQGIRWRQHGYRVVLAKDAHGCTDPQLLSAETIIAHHNAILGECFADVIDVAEIEL